MLKKFFFTNDFKKCENYLACQAIHKQVDRIDKENINQEASLKSIHKRMDKIGNDINELSRASVTQASVLSHHMEWEEKYHEWMKKALIFIVITGLPAIVGYIKWNYDAHNEKMIELSKQSESNKELQKVLVNIDNNQKVIDKNQRALQLSMTEISTKVINNTNLMNRNYGQIQGLQNKSIK